MDGGTAWYGLRGTVVRFSKYEAIRPFGASIQITPALRDAMTRAEARASARGTVGRTESVRWMETNMATKKDSLQARVERLESDVREAPDAAADARVAERRVSDLEVRLGFPGTPKYLYLAELSCGRSIKVVASSLDEALAKAGAFVRKEEHEAEVVKVERTSDEAVDVC